MQQGVGVCPHQQQGASNPSPSSGASPAPLLQRRKRSHSSHIIARACCSSFDASTVLPSVPEHTLLPEPSFSLLLSTTGDTGKCAAPVMARCHSDSALRSVGSDSEAIQALAVRRASHASLSSFLDSDSGQSEMEDLFEAMQDPLPSEHSVQSSPSPTDSLQSNYGVFHFENGDRYEGETSRGDFHGHGRYEHANGEWYEGVWEHGIMHGAGTLQFANGDRYEGEWRDGLQHGKGTYVYADGERYEGAWAFGVKHGVGVNMHVDGGWYEGEFAGDCKSGRGVFSFPSGDCYTGEFQGGYFHGSGLYKYADGSFYDGHWEFDNKHGPGLFSCDGEQYVGAFRNGVMHGHGLHVDAAGRRRAGVWANGHLESWITLQDASIDRGGSKTRRASDSV